MYGLNWDAVAIGGAELMEGVLTCRPLASWDDISNPAVQKLIALADANKTEQKLRDQSHAIAVAYHIVGAEVISRAVDEVGWDGLNGEAVYNQLVQLKDFMPLGGLNYWTFTEQIRSSNKGFIAEIHNGKIMPITPWHELPDLSPGGPWSGK